MRQTHAARLALSLVKRAIDRHVQRFRARFGTDASRPQARQSEVLNGETGVGQVPVTSRFVETFEAATAKPRDSRFLGFAGRVRSLAQGGRPRLANPEGDLAVAGRVDRFDQPGNAPDHRLWLSILVIIHENVAKGAMCRSTQAAARQYMLRNVNSCYEWVAGTIRVTRGLK